MGGDPSRVRVTGPLAVFAEGFCGELARLGYKPKAAADQLRLMAHLSRWMDAGSHGVAGLTRPVTEAFLAARRAEGYVLWLSPKALVPLLGYLRELGVIPQPAPDLVTRSRRCWAGISAICSPSAAWSPRLPAGMRTWSARSWPAASKPASSPWPA
jgi:hypothetical protein